MSEIKVYRNLMGANDVWAEKCRGLLKEKKVLMLNFIGSPGCGKTTFLEKTAEALGKKVRFAVLEGDVETTRDAERLHAVQVIAYQLITGGACHLSAKLVYHGLRDLPLNDLDVVIVENVGNMVCPAEFDIGEHMKVAFLSVTEGEDKPIKYPSLFRESGAVVLTKTDLLPHLRFDLAACMGYVKQVNSAVPVFEISSFTASGFSQWIDWISGLARHEKTA
ncbi:MAG: hydrogenase accessory protein HypB [Candidatus Raymondbacteria bacterium RifOxyA12_full_50_37]|uniref:Hydrogenase accessory protein HypB n=1 Tax=Candidatus Raymondbacteria bacterium RIFOXYD12_FULL_49_13 TaxID=1817890 RepID=A0A1F7F229_UNCRA|nr:MAG: hydrogenase accessory protein HypB [Candidatus Raymondbacteria bacterium RifOxyA12_full_50_37]OGJ86430.1 MAG: hydrogenase accessory protein HypB [Candidatus Raymondbacteria bacterium RIFOXYA2_FULL_49_16]OGJ90478.1 MAG: hydrogenase accessory protein HypB [Candidatus Raymondbacteria bacterium RifOxyB12_full_50_8]OGJ95600.1 MAG: hydrogenase accessory protein HypB [Candidatus Raymondbacteria bacterium RIFOXYC2_FULL_50_21]OGK00658.1 MAG: hydrogenase accessory protein HypB [Candidatus Raymond